VVSSADLHSWGRLLWRKITLEHFFGQFPKIGAVTNGIHAAIGVSLDVSFSVFILFAIGLAPLGYALLETTGRKTGKARGTLVGDGWVGYQFWLVAEHGIKAGYVSNIAANPRVRLKLRHGILARWHTGTAQALPDDDARERQRWLAGRRIAQDCTFRMWLWSRHCVRYINLTKGRVSCAF
jgi:deazaflavin-dependent oxidoreductase (nitroreductase family)